MSSSNNIVESHLETTSIPVVSHFCFTLYKQAMGSLHAQRSAYIQWEWLARNYLCF